MDTLVSEEVAVGTVVKALNIPFITGTPSDTSPQGVVSTGQTVTVTKVRKREDGTIVSLDAEFSRGGYSTSYNFDMWEMLDQTTFLPVSLKNLTVDELKANLKSVQQQYLDEQAKAAKALADLNETKRTAFLALGIISERLISESEARQWCAEFDKIIDDVNEELTWPWKLLTREKEWTVSWLEEISVTVRRDIMVLAKNMDDAIEFASNNSDCAEEYEILEAVKGGNWEFDSARDYDAEEN